MLKNSYRAINDKSEDMSWETWILETERDDERRFAELKRICKKRTYWNLDVEMVVFSKKDSQCGEQCDRN